MAGPSAEAVPPAHRRTLARGLGGALLLAQLLLPGCSAPPGQVTGADLPEIQKRGVLRVLLPRHQLPQVLPTGSPRPDQAFAADFARDLGLQVQWVYTDNRDNLIPLLLAGVGDLVGSELEITPERREQVAFSVPLGLLREQVVVRADRNDEVAGTPDLHDMTVALHASSAAWRRLELLQEEIPGLDLAALPESQTLGKTLDQVADGFYDATVLPSELSQALLPTRPSLKAAFYLGNERPVAWAVHPGATALRTALDRYIYAHRLTEKPPETYLANLAEIKKRGVLRVLTRNNPATFFLLRGERLGFEYELVRAFAKRLGVRVEMVIPPSRDALIPWLEQGRGDLIAASLTITWERRKIPDIAFSIPYNYATETVVSRAGDPPLHSLQDLNGREVVARHSSSYWESVQKLQREGITVKLKAAPEEQETEWIIGQVANGNYDLTVADSPILDIERTWRDDIRGDLTLGEPVPHGWAVRSDDSDLLEAVNAFIKEFYRSTDYNLIYRKYFRDSRGIRHHVAQRTARSGALSPYDDTVRRFADEYGFDWRLIVALMHQESRFDPEAESLAGARGLMQLMPRTARDLGLADRTDEEGSIQGGIRYLAQLRQRFSPEIPLVERTWMALAAYNAGFGHVEDARRLAKSHKLDPDRWDDNVEEAMSLLSLDKYSRDAEHGYCRCTQAIHYVQQIRARYDAYVNVTGATAVAGNLPTQPVATLEADTRPPAAPDGAPAPSAKTAATSPAPPQTPPASAARPPEAPEVAAKTPAVAKKSAASGTTPTAAKPAKRPEPPAPVARGTTPAPVAAKRADSGTPEAAAKALPAPKTPPPAPLAAETPAQPPAEPPATAPGPVAEAAASGDVDELPAPPPAGEAAPAAPDPKSSPVAVAEEPKPVGGPEAPATVAEVKPPVADAAAPDSGTGDPVGVPDGAAQAAPITEPGPAVGATTDATDELPAAEGG